MPRQRSAIPEWMTTAHASTGNASGAMSIGDAARLRSLVKLAAAHATHTVVGEGSPHMVMDNLDQEDSATRIQRATRAWHARHCLTRSKKAATTIQASWRGRLAATAIKDFRSEFAQRTKIGRLLLAVEELQELADIETARADLERMRANQEQRRADEAERQMNRLSGLLAGCRRCRSQRPSLMHEWW